MANLDNNNDGKDAIDTSVDGIRKAVEGAGASDEGDDEEEDDDDEGDDADDDDSSGDDAGGDDSNDSDDSDDADDEEEDDDAETDDKKDPKSDRKYSQFKGDGTDTAYISNLEEGYKNSSAEAIRLKGEFDSVSGRLDSLLRVVASDEELSKKVNSLLGGSGAGGSGSGNGSDENQSEDLSDPFILSARTEWQEKAEAEIQEIIDANPEVASDPELSKDIKHYMSLFSKDYLEKNKKLMGGGEAMLAAMKHLGIEDKRGKQDLAQGAKKNLTPPRSRGNKAKKSGGQKPQFTASQIAMAKAMGKDEAWLQKNAS